MQLSPYLIGGKIMQMVLGLILQLYPIASKTQLKDALHITFLDNIRSSSFLKMLLFLSYLSDNKVQTAIIWC